MTPKQCGLDPVWSFSSLPGIRETANQSAFGAWSLDSLPPIPNHLFDGTFDWLTNAPVYIGTTEDAESFAESIGKLNALKDRTTALGLKLPSDFMRFMTAPLLATKIERSALFFVHSERIVRNPRGAGFFVQFMEECQGCEYWNLYLHPEHGHCVVTSTQNFGDLLSVDLEIKDQSQHICEFSAPCFESFIYRLWIESSVCCKLHNDDSALTPTEREYLAHYARDA